MSPPKRIRNNETTDATQALASAARPVANALLEQVDHDEAALSRTWRHAIRRTLQACVAQSAQVDGANRSLGEAAAVVRRAKACGVGWSTMTSALDHGFGRILEPGWSRQPATPQLDAAVGAMAAGLPDLTPRLIGQTLAPLMGLATSWREGGRQPYGVKRKRQGLYFTPAGLTDALLEDVDATEPKWASGIPWTCDPACGSGAMLLRVHGHLSRTASTDAVLARLHGVDVDPLAVEHARTGLWALVGFDEAAVDGLAERVRCGNALVGRSPPGAPRAQLPTPGTERPLHWDTAFEPVWDAGGFDLVLLNPPWERVKFQARDYLRTAHPEAAAAAHRAARDQALATEGGDDVAREMARHRADAKVLSAYLRGCGAFASSAHGDLNTYPLFVERAWQLLAPGGRAGLIVPSGLATDYGHRRLLGMLLDEGGLASFHDFENRARAFEDVDSRFRYALVVLTRRYGRSDAQPRPVRGATLLHRPGDRAQPGRSWTLSASDIRALNPLSHTMPMFRSQQSARDGLAMHRHAPIWDSDADPAAPGEGWSVRFQRMFDMTNDASLFIDARELASRGARTMRDDRLGWIAEADGADWMPLYEGKLFWQHDGAFATFGSAVPPSAPGGKRPRATPAPFDGDPRASCPRFWVPSAKVRARLARDDAEVWLVIRALTNPTNVRTLVAALIPPTAVGNSALIVHAHSRGGSQQASDRWLPLLVANLNALVLDDLARQKMGNTNVNMYMLRQLPLLTPERYAHVPFAGGPTAGELVATRALGLAYGCAPVGRAERLANGWPMVSPLVSIEARRQATAELDALFAHLYGFDEARLRRVIDAHASPHPFAALKRSEERQWGRFDTSERVLKAFRTAAQWATRAVDSGGRHHG